MECQIYNEAVRLFSHSCNLFFWRLKIECYQIITELMVLLTSDHFAGFHRRHSEAQEELLPGRAGYQGSGPGQGREESPLAFWKISQSVRSNAGYSGALRVGRDQPCHMHSAESLLSPISTHDKLRPIAPANPTNSRLVHREAARAYSTTRLLNLAARRAGRCNAVPSLRGVHGPDQQSLMLR